jgi:hypothetical protein
MNSKWDIQELRIDVRLTKAQEREGLLRPLAKLIARRLLAEELANQEKTGQTMDPKRQEVAS